MCKTASQYSRFGRPRLLTPPPPDAASSSAAATASRPAAAVWSPWRPPEAPVSGSVRSGKELVVVQNNSSKPCLAHVRTCRWRRPGTPRQTAAQRSAAQRSMHSSRISPLQQFANPTERRSPRSLRALRWLAVLSHPSSCGQPCCPSRQPCLQPCHSILSSLTHSTELQAYNPLHRPYDRGRKQGAGHPGRPRARPATPALAAQPDPPAARCARRAGRGRSRQCRWQPRW